MNHCIKILVVLLFPALAWSSDLRPQRLKCEYQIDPLGIDAANPRLSWVLESEERGQRQTAYQIIVTALPQAAGNSDVLWDTGKVASDETIQIEYAGKPLASREHCWWRVRAVPVHGPFVPGFQHSVPPDFQFFRPQVMFVAGSYFGITAPGE